MRLKVSRVLVTAGLLAAAMLQGAAAQNITIDGHLSPAQTLVGPNYAITANLGKQVGSNLFHSFGKFGMASSESATFSGPATVSNVIGRVTGGAQSSIDGKIASTITGASLYLINPSGIVFGPNATVNVSGGFHASTADYLRMSDGAKFQATNPGSSTLSAAPPAAFGFLTAQPAKITVNGSSLGVPSRQTLGLVGGPVSIKGGTLSAPAGTINVTSAAGAGEVPVDPRNTAALTVTSFGPVKIKGGATLDVSNADALGGGGSVFIRSGALTIDASEINGDNYGSDPGGVISLRGDNQITLSNGANVHAVAMSSGSGADVLLSTASSRVISADASTVLTDTLGPGNGGALSLDSGRLTLIIGAKLTSSAQGTGNGGPIKISASSVLLDGASTIGSTTVGAGLTGPSGNPVPAGAGGAISITAESLTIQGGASIATNSAGDGAGGAVALNIRGMLTVANLGAIASRAGANGDGGPIVIAAGAMLVDGSSAQNQPTGVVSSAFGPGKGGDVVATSGTLSILPNGELGSITFGSGDAGSVSVNIAGALTIDGTNANPILLLGTGISSRARFDKGSAGQVQIEASSLAIANGGLISSSTLLPSTGNAGNVIVLAGDLSVASNGTISTDTSGSGNGGNVSLSVAGRLYLDGSNATGFTGISSMAKTGSSGAAGNTTVSAGTLSIIGNGAISSGTSGTGNAGSVSVSVAGLLSIDGMSSTAPSGIVTDSGEGAAGSAGVVNIRTGTLSIVNTGQISSNTSATGSGGSVSVSVAGQLSIGGITGQSNTGIFANSNSSAQNSGDAGTVTVSAGDLAIAGDGGEISSITSGSGKAGSVTVNAGHLSLLDNAFISSSTFGLGPGGNVSVTAGSLTIAGSGDINSFSSGSGHGGSVSVNITGDQPGALTILTNGSVRASTFGAGDAGSVAIRVAGGLTIDSTGANPHIITGISSQANPGSTGKGGDVTVSAGNLSIVNNGQISSSTFGPGNGGSVTIDVAGRLTIDGSGKDPSFPTGIFAQANQGSTGNAGSLTVSAGSLSLVNNGQISSGTFGPSNGGSLTIDVAGRLSIDGSGEDQLSPTGISAQANPGSTGNAGSVTVDAVRLFIVNNGQISGVTFGPGNAGSVTIGVAGAISIDGTGGNPAIPTGINAKAEQGSTGNAGGVSVSAGSLVIGGAGSISTNANGSGTAGTVAVALAGDAVLSGGAVITSATIGAGNGGTVRLSAQGPLALSGQDTGIIASATSTASGNAGSVLVSAPQITITKGGEIASTSAGTGAGGSVLVTTPGMLALDGAGFANTQIAASAIGPQSGPGGDVTVAANALTIEGGARIASSTASTLETGKGGNVDIAVASDIVLPDPGPQITARSTGSGDAGSITVSAVRLMMNNGSSISTEAETSTANGGNITLQLRDFLYLVSSEISTSVKGETGSGGNIVIDPQLVILNHSSIIAEAIKGHGGDITITAGQFIPSTDSIVSATSELGISGEVVINGPRVDVNGALVVLSTQLRGRNEVLREACAARADRPISSLVEAGRGGLPQDPDATLPALYIAGRDINPKPEPVEKSAPLHTTVRLTMRCG